MLSARLARPGCGPSRCQVLSSKRLRVNVPRCAAASELPLFSSYCKVFLRSNPDYESKRDQYAYSSLKQEGDMEPYAIIYPRGHTADDDVLKAINFAKANGVSIAVRTGGHQYSGASSTAGNNIVLDLSEAYSDKVWNPESGEFRLGVRFSLQEMNEELGKRGLFVPHGQCLDVHVGGHAQTGGYGQLGRSFGLFADHIVAIRIITADGQIREIRRDAASAADADLFYAVVGGSPGNFGVLTHITLRPLRDEDYPDSRGLKALVWYDRSTLSKLLTIVADMAATDDLAADYDFCVSVLSITGRNLLNYYFEDKQREAVRKELEEWDKEHEAKRTRRSFIPFIDGYPAVILVYAQWANRGGVEHTYDSAVESWFQTIADAMSNAKKWAIGNLDVDYRTHRPMSELTRMWCFNGKREFDIPYNKRTYITNSTQLNESGWVDATVEQIDRLKVGEFDNGLCRCRVVVQIQPFGGKESRFFVNGNTKQTSLSWRDTSVVCVLDCFHDPCAKERADEWQTINDKLLKGDNGVKGVFSEDDRRVLWGSYHATPEEKDMAVAWPLYHESQEKYDKLRKIKTAVDPHDVFSPNLFCIKAIRDA